MNMVLTAFVNLFVLHLSFPLLFSFAIVIFQQSLLMAMFLMAMFLQIPCVTVIKQTEL